MKINDVVYGEEVIEEPALVELINCDAIQRLKGVSQMGMPEEYWHRKVYSRFDHSVGVLILLRRLGASLEEQVAGVIHDVSHTAFSHVIDWVYGDPTKEDHQDNTFLEVLENSEIPNILMKHGFDYRVVGDIKSYLLLERPIPNLCADRVDYSLKEIVLSYNPEDVFEILNDLNVVDDEIVLGSLETAKLFATYYVHLNKEHWTGEESKARYHILSDSLKIGLEEDIISFNDFMKTDEIILEKLESSHYPAILSGLNLLRRGFSIEEVDSGGIVLEKKFRYIDPKFIHNGGVSPLSEAFPEYRETLEKEREDSLHQKQILVRPLK